MEEKEKAQLASNLKNAAEEMYIDRFENNSSDIGR